MFQFWKRKKDGDDKLSVDKEESTQQEPSIDWSTKKPLSFKDDYVSFPSLDPIPTTNTELSCSN